MAASKSKSGKVRRTRAHELGEIGRLRFETIRPIGWVVHKIDGSDDYGRDGFVEIFEKGEATGEEFFTQYKGTDSQREPKTQIRVALLNLWQDQPSPLLILNWSEGSEQLTYQWAHLLDLHNVKAGQVQRTVPVPNLWTDDTPAELVREVRAYRAARTLSQHFPIDVVVRGESVFGVAGGEVVAALLDLLSPMREFNVTFGTPSIPFLQIELRDDGMHVNLSGARVRSLTYGGAHKPPPEVLAADAVFALAFAVGVTGGSPDVGASLLALASPASMMALRAGRLGDAVAILAARGDDAAVMTLLQRTMLIEGDPNASEAFHALHQLRTELSEPLVGSIVGALEQACTSWKRPEVGIVWAAQISYHKDRRRSVRLWKQAASLDPTLKNRRVFWSELGGLYFLLELFKESAEHYRHAVRMGDERSRPFWADALLWNGEYAAALQEYERSAIREGDEHAEWRRNWVALDILVSRGWRQQARDWFSAERMWAANIERGGKPTDEFIEQVLEKDLLFGWAHWAKAPRDAARDIIPLDHLLFASIALPGVAPIWQELIDSALRAGFVQTARDSMLLARQFCRNDFLKLIHTDTKHISTEHRRLLVALWANLDDEMKFLDVIAAEAARQEADAEVGKREGDDDGAR